MEMERYNLDDDDMILPDDFDPNAESYDLYGENSSEQVAPTTEQSAENDNEVTNPLAEANEFNQEPTTSLEEQVITPTVKVKYNHEDRELSLDEAAVYAQKGMNYDKLDEKVKNFEARNARSEFLAKQLGYDSADEMLEAAATNYRNRQIRELEEAGNTRAMAEFLVDQRLKSMPTSTPVVKEEEAAPEPETPTSKLSPERKAELDEFVKLYPGVVNLPPEVLKANASGIRLSVAYEQYKSKAAQQELAIMKQNQASAAKAPVTGTVGKAAPEREEPDDPFVKGFDSDDY